jgi:hypothetical protein
MVCPKHFYPRFAKYILSHGFISVHAFDDENLSKELVVFLTIILLHLFKNERHKQFVQDNFIPDLLNAFSLDS